MEEIKHGCEAIPSEELHLASQGLSRARSYKDQTKDRLSFWPLLDRGGSISVSGSAGGPIGTLARIELNELDGLPPGDGLPEDALQQPGAP